MAAAISRCTSISPGSTSSSGTRWKHTCVVRGRFCLADRARETPAKAEDAAVSGGWRMQPPKCRQEPQHAFLLCHLHARRGREATGQWCPTDPCRASCPRAAFQLERAAVFHTWMALLYQPTGSNDGNTFLSAHTACNQMRWAHKQERSDRWEDTEGAGRGGGATPRQDAHCSCLTSK